MSVVAVDGGNDLLLKLAMSVGRSDLDQAEQSRGSRSAQQMNGGVCGGVHVGHKLLICCLTFLDEGPHVKGGEQKDENQRYSLLQSQCVSANSGGRAQSGGW